MKTYAYPMPGGGPDRVRIAPKDGGYVVSVDDQALVSGTLPLKVGLDDGSMLTVEASEGIGTGPIVRIRGADLPRSYGHPRNVALRAACVLYTFALLQVGLAATAFSYGDSSATFGLVAFSGAVCALLGWFAQMRVHAALGVAVAIELLGLLGSMASGSAAFIVHGLLAILFARSYLALRDANARARTTRSRASVTA